MAKIKYLILYIPVVAIIAIYAGHALAALGGSEEFFAIIGTLGLSASLTTILVYAIFPLDGTVALLLVFGNRFSSNFPWNLLYLWVGLWPWVPRVMEWHGGLEPEIGDAILVSVLAVLAYYLHSRKRIAFLR